MSVGAAIYSLISDAWKHGYTARVERKGGTLESIDCVTSTISALTDIELSGTNTGLQGLVLNSTDNKVQPMRNAQKVKPPRLTYQVIGNDPSDTKYDVSKLDQVTVKIACHAKYYEDAEAVLKDLRVNLDRYQGTLAGVALQSVQFIDQRDLFSEDADLVGIAQDYKFRIKR